MFNGGERELTIGNDVGSSPEYAQLLVEICCVGFYHSKVIRDT